MPVEKGEKQPQGRSSRRLHRVLCERASPCPLNICPVTSKLVDMKWLRRERRARFPHQPPSNVELTERADVRKRTHRSRSRTTLSSSSWCAPETKSQMALNATGLSRKFR